MELKNRAITCERLKIKLLEIQKKKSVYFLAKHSPNSTFLNFIALYHAVSCRSSRFPTKKCGEVNEKVKKAFQPDLL